MVARILALVLIFSLNEISAQIPEPLRFPHQNIEYSYTRSSILGLPNGDLLYFWVEDEESEDRILYQSRSIDNGLNWSEPEIISEEISYYYLTDNITSALLDSSKIALMFKTQITFSYDNGNTWTSITNLIEDENPIERRRVTSVNISNDQQGNVYVCYGKRIYQDSISFEIRFIKSSDNGNTWSDFNIITESTNKGNGFIFPKSDQELLLFFEDRQSSNSDIKYLTSSDNGETWQDTVYIATTELNEKRPKVIRENSNILYLLYELEKETLFEGFYQKDIVYKKSTDNGNSWGNVNSVTQYRGKDFNNEVTKLNNQVFYSFASSRSFNDEEEKYQFYLGIIGETIDNNAPPYMYYSEHIPETPEPLEQVKIRCYPDDEAGLSSVKLISRKNLSKIDTLDMFDDGMHGDSLANDGIYGITFNDLILGDLRQYSFLISDVDDNVVHFKGDNIALPLDFDIGYFLFDVNRFKLPINNRGKIADLRDTITNLHGGRFDDNNILFSGGFLLSGYTNGNLWANGVASASLIEDYLPGKIDLPPNDPKNNIYVVKSTDADFGTSWQNWSYAVSLGADFYDGDGDDEYNPVDLNGNGVWDLNEDKPDMLGDVTTWSVYNDGVPSDERRFENVEPQGLEIQQTAFASGFNLTGAIQNIIFFRYRLINRGTVASELDSVIFALWTDPDIGEDFEQDFGGTDTLLNTAIAYKKDSDGAYGDNPPALFTNFLQGPLSYIPGETFIDNNMNGTYDDGIDTPIDTAYHFNGLYLGSEIFPGAKNLDASSYVQFLNGFSQVFQDPGNEIEARNYMLGKELYGNYVDPCTLPIGEVMGGVNCTEVDPVFWHSGDPVTNYGWINTQAWDQRMMINSGPFQLKENKPVDIWVAYIVGRGNDPLNSVTRGREITQYAIDYYETNFTTLPVGIENQNNLITDYHLYQNYPNPFNPTTTIKFTIPEKGSRSPLERGQRGVLTKLIVYDILGREITTLVKEVKQPGVYEVTFDASTLASGVYFYRLKANNYSSVKKMILLK